MCCGEIQRRFTVATPAMTFTDENLATVITFETLKEFFGFVRWDSGIVANRASGDVQGPRAAPFG